MGHEVACELIATKSVTPEAARPVYSHCAIIETAADLPDGDYEVEFGGEVAITRRQNGSWQVGSILPHTYREVANFYASRQRGSRRGSDGARRQSGGSAPSRSANKPQ